MSTPIKPIKLLYEDKEVATLSQFFYEFPWFSAKAEFIDTKLRDKMEALTTLVFYELKLVEEELSDSEQETLWEKKRVELGLSSDDLGLNLNGWSVIWDDNSIEDVGTINFEEGWLSWRMGITR